jgi:hypothetical protein
MYRQNRKKWKFLISAKFIGLDKGYVRLEELEFKKWARMILAHFEIDKISDGDVKSIGDFDEAVVQVLG